MCHNVKVTCAANKAYVHTVACHTCQWAVATNFAGVDAVRAQEVSLHKLFFLYSIKCLIYLAASIFETGLHLAAEVSRAGLALAAEVARSGRHLAANLASSVCYIIRHQAMLAILHTTGSH